MTQAEREMWFEGRVLWREYVNSNGYSFTYTDKGVSKLAKLLDLKPHYIKKRLYVYLES